MKKTILLLLSLYCTVNSFSQETLTFSITPSNFEDDTQITITFSGIDSNVWNTNAPLYLWAWSYDSNDLNSLNAPNNGDWTNSESRTTPQVLTKNSNNTYSITFTPTTFYNRTEIGKIGFLVKNVNGSIQSTDMETEVGAAPPPPMVTEATLPANLKDGINFNSSDNTRATLVLYAPGKDFVHLIGDFNDWTIEDTYLLKKDSTKDRFWIELTGLTPQKNHLYQYVINRTLRIADPYSTLVLTESNDQFINAVTYPDLPTYPTGKTNHAVTVLKTGETPFTWEVTNFERPKKTDLVIYEILLRDFDSLHSFDALKARLDYLETLGINAIELMPVSEFDGNESWGYNPSFHMALDKYYGTKEAFKQLIDECHKRGIAVILDVVYNHATGQNPYYRMWNTVDGDYGGKATAENPFFNEEPKHSFNVFNDFDHSAQVTKEYVKRTTQYWIDEFKIDGFRWDLTKGFTQNCSESDDSCTNAMQADRVTVLKEYADYQWEIDADFYVIFEHLGTNEEETEWVNYRLSEGKGILMWSNLNGNYNETTLGYHTNGKSDFSWISYKKRGWSVPANIAYMESHDEERLMYKNIQFGNSNSNYNVKDINTALNRTASAGAFYFTIPGPKMIWQFGELGYDVAIDFNGRTGNKPIRWEYFNETERKEIYTLWSKLIALKKQEDIFRTSNFTLDVSKDTGLKKIHLSNDNTSDDLEHVTIIGNFGIIAQNITPEFQKTGTWFNLLESNSTISVTDVNATLLLQPGEFKIYGSSATTLSNEDVAKETSSLNLYPNPSTNYFTFNKEVKDILVYDISGKEVISYSGSYAKDYPFSIKQLSNGIYFIKGKKQSISFNKKLIVK